jgi:two-component system, NarL family, nitrate/nitrite response regulator NarL
MPETTSTIRILIADDHPVFRYGLRTLLESEPRLAVVGEAVDGSEVVKMIAAVKPNILLLDLAMPRLTGIEVLREMAYDRSAVRTIVLTAAIENRQIVEALQLGARGILLKDAATQLVTKCIEKVMGGEYWVGHEAVTNLVDYLRGLGGIKDVQKSQKLMQFTPRERQIISAIIVGCANKEIASRLSLSEDTVKHHLSHIFAKAGVSNRLELAIWSMNQGFL